MFDASKEVLAFIKILNLGDVPELDMALLALVRLAYAAGRAAERARLLTALDDIPFRTVGEGAILARVADLIRDATPPD